MIAGAGAGKRPDRICCGRASPAPRGGWVRSGRQALSAERARRQASPNAIVVQALSVLNNLLWDEGQTRSSSGARQSVELQSRPRPRGAAPRPRAGWRCALGWTHVREKI